MSIRIDYTSFNLETESPLSEILVNVIAFNAADSGDVIRANRSSLTPPV